MRARSSQSIRGTVPHGRRHCRSSLAGSPSLAYSSISNKERPGRERHITVDVVGTTAREARNTGVEHFVRNHARTLLVSDFYVAVTATFRVIYVFVEFEPSQRLDSVGSGVTAGRFGLPTGRTPPPSTSPGQHGEIALGLSERATRQRRGRGGRRL